MSNLNRGRPIVDPVGPWRMHLRAVPAGFRCLGTVQRRQHIGALLVDAAGAYWCARGCVLERLIDRKINAALQALP